MNTDRRALVEEMLRDELEAGRPVCCAVVSESMRPLLRSGDRVLLELVQSATIDLGDVLVHSSAGEWVTHRLVAMDQTRQPVLLITKGDAAAEPDRPWSIDELVARVRSVERKQHRLDLTAHNQRLLTRLARLDWQVGSSGRAGRIRRIQRRVLRVLAKGAASLIWLTDKVTLL